MRVLNIKVLLDYGPYKHFVLSEQGTSFDPVEIMMWPGSISYQSNECSFLFAFSNDMDMSVVFDGWNYKDPPLQYLAERCDSSGVYEFCKEKAMELARDLCSEMSEEEQQNFLCSAEDAIDYYESEDEFISFVDCERLVKICDLPSHSCSKFTKDFTECCKLLILVIKDYNSK